MQCGMSGRTLLLLLKIVEDSRLHIMPVWLNKLFFSLWPNYHQPTVIIFHAIPPSCLWNKPFLQSLYFILIPSWNIPFLNGFSHFSFGYFFLVIGFLLYWFPSAPFNIWSRKHHALSGFPLSTKLFHCNTPLCPKLAYFVTFSILVFISCMCDFFSALPSVWSWWFSYGPAWHSDFWHQYAKAAYARTTTAIVANNNAACPQTWYEYMPAAIALMPHLGHVHYGLLSAYVYPFIVTGSITITADQESPDKNTLCSGL